VEVPKVFSYLSPYVRKCWMDDVNNDEDDADEPAAIEKPAEKPIQKLRTEIVSPILSTPIVNSIKSPDENSFTGEVDDAE